MSQKVLTLFGEEIIPEVPKPAPKPRAEKKTAPEKVTEEKPEKEIKPVPEKAKAEQSPKERKAAVAKVPKAKKESAPKVSSDELLKEFNGEKQYYSIGEVAKLFKVNTSHIRFWTNEFKLKVRTTRKGDRLYTTEQIKELKAIYHLVKERGYTIAGAKAKLKEKRKTTIEGLSLKESLLHLREKLTQIKKELKG